MRRLLPAHDLNVRGRVVYQIQRANRRLNTSYLELFYQQSFLGLADRTPWVTSVPLASPSGGTASFSLLYSLLCILADARPSRLLELGVGQSSLLLRDYVRDEAAQASREAVHVDDSAGWLEDMAPVNRGSLPLHCPLKSIEIAGRAIEWYDLRLPRDGFDLVLVDGPEASQHANRYNRLGALEVLPSALGDEFVVIIDDADRVGERLLVRELLRRCASDGIDVGTRRIVGGNTQVIVATSSYSRFLYL